MKVAGIDVTKKVLMGGRDGNTPEEKPARRRFVTMPSDPATTLRGGAVRCNSLVTLLKKSCFVRNAKI